MIKYEIVRNTENKCLVDYCFSILENENVTQLPSHLVTGQRETIFNKGKNRITLVSDGNRQGHFILCQNIPSGTVLYYTSASFRY